MNNFTNTSTCLLLAWGCVTVLASSRHTAHSGSDLEDKKRGYNESRFIRKLLDGVDPRVRPAVPGGGPVNVECGMYITSFGSVNEINMDFKMSVLFREIWMDPSLSYDSGPSVVSLSSRAEQEIWLPDIYFPNEKHAKIHTVTVPNSLIKIYPNGTVIHSVRISLTFSCNMDLTAFPMDSQLCDSKIESFAYETHEMTLSWMPDPVEMDDELELPQFDLGEYRTATCQKDYKTTGAYSCLRVTFALHRQFGFYLLQTYIPSILVVILSWVSFWINMDAVPARISLGVTTVLTMATQLSGASSSMPRVSYPKALDVWLSVCMIFVFASLLEYAFVNAFSRRHQRELRKHHITDSNDQKQHENTVKTTAEISENGFVSIRHWAKCNKQNMARSIDRLCRIIFPAAFLAFNLVYWPSYSTYQC